MMLLISKASSKLISGEGNFERPIHLKIGSPIRRSSQLAVSLLSSLDTASETNWSRFVWTREADSQVPLP